MSSLFSARWHRVAGTRPRLVAEVRVRRQRSRGLVWHVFTQPSTGRSVRLDPAAHALAARLDGTRTVQALWDSLLEQPHDPPTQDDVVGLLAQLREAGLLQLGGDADFEGLVRARSEDERAQAAPSPRAGGSLFAWRLPLFDPGPWLARLAPVGRLAFSRAGCAAWLAAVSALVLLALQNATLLAAHARIALADPRSALLGLVLMLPLKALHELAHALAVQRLGGGVRSAGVSLLMGLPLPWVDASAAAAFERRRDRALVGAAGMMAELAVAAAALPAWLALHARGDGVAADALFTTLMLAGLSTLVFNANPLQRFDGYFIACDLLDLPNLATRSRSWWTARLEHRLLGAGAHDRLPVARGETAWLALFAPASWLMSMGLAVAATAWLARLAWPLALAAGALLAWQVALRPPMVLARRLASAARTTHGSAQRWRRGVGIAVAATLALALLPLPRHTLVQGVVWPADEAQLRAGEDGFVVETVARDGTAVQVGDVVLRLANPALETRLARQSAQVAALEATLVDAQALRAATATADSGDLGDARAKLAAAQADMQRLQERVGLLVVRARTAGRVALAPGDDLQGRYFHRGALVGELVTDAPATVRVAWAQADAATLFRLRTEQAPARVRLAASPAVDHAATLMGDGTGAVERLPSAALSDRHGGPVPTDPKDADDVRPVQPVVLVDVRLADDAQPPGSTARRRLGERAWVRFDEGLAPLAWQGLTGLWREVAHRLDSGA